LSKGDEFKNTIKRLDYFNNKQNEENISKFMGYYFKQINRFSPNKTNNNEIDKKHGVYTYFDLREVDKTYKPDPNQIIDIVKTLPVNQSIQFLSVLSRILFLKKPYEFEKQKSILDLMKISNPDYFLQYLKTKKFNVIFHPHQILFCFCLIIQYGNNKVRFNGDFKHHANIFQILIYINTILSPKDTENTIDTTKVLGHLWQLNFLWAPYNNNLKQEFARTFYLFYKKDDKNEFSQCFESITGNKIEDYIAAFFAIYAYTGSDDLNTIINNTTFDLSGLFKNCKGINLGIIKQITHYLSDTKGKLKQNLKRKYKYLGNEKINFETLYEKPICEIENGKHVCLSLEFLLHNLNRGLVDFEKRIMRDIIRNNPQELESLKKIEDRIAKYTGTIYENYIYELLKNIYTDEGYSKRLYRGKSKSIEIGDAVIDYGDKLIIIEVKSMALQKKCKLTQNLVEIKKGVKSFFTDKGFKQIDSTIKKLKLGDIAIGNIEPSKIKKFYPVVVSCIDDLPNRGFFIDFYNSILKKKKLLQTPDIGPITILSLKEFENLMNVLYAGNDFVKIIEDKNTIKNYHLPFMNYLTQYSYKDEIIHEVLNPVYTEFTDFVIKQLALEEKNAKIY